MYCHYSFILIVTSESNNSMMWLLFRGFTIGVKVYPQNPNPHTNFRKGGSERTLNKTKIHKKIRIVKKGKSIGSVI